MHNTTPAHRACGVRTQEEDTVTMEVLKLIETLRGGAERFPRRKELLLLSGMTHEEQSALREAWPHIPVESRRLLTKTLLETAEADATATFDEVFFVALHDPDEQVRVTALQGLWEYTEETFIPTLIDMMDHDPSVAVRAEAATRLGRFAMAGEVGELDPEATDLVSRALIAVWNSPDEDVEVRRRALESVSCLATDEVNEMIQAAYSDKDERMNISAVYAMGQTLDYIWAPYILEELKNPRPEMRYEAAHAAGELALIDAMPVLLDLAHDTDAEVRVAAITALGDIGGERAVEALLSLARSADETTRDAALDALELAIFAENPLSSLAWEWATLWDTESEPGAEDELQGEWEEEWDVELDEAEDEDEDDWQHDDYCDRWN